MTTKVSQIYVNYFQEVNKRHLSYRKKILTKYVDEFIFLNPDAKR